jgi:hypothetical protein
VPTVGERRWIIEPLAHGEYRVINGESEFCVRFPQQVQAQAVADLLNRPDPLKAELVEALKRSTTALEVAVHRHEQAIAMARADGAFVPEEFGERECDVFRIAIRENRAALARAREGEKHG